MRKQNEVVCTLWWWGTLFSLGGLLWSMIIAWLIVLFEWYNIRQFVLWLVWGSGVVFLGSLLMVTYDESKARKDKISKEG